MDTFEEELIALTPELRQRALRLTKDTEAAADLVQEVFVRVLKKHPHFVSRTDLRKSTASVLYEIFRTEKELHAAADVRPMGTAAYRVMVDAAQIKRRYLREVWNRIGSLTPDKREALLARIRSPRTYAELASEMQVNPKTLQQRVYRARMELKHAAGRNHCS